MSNRDEVGTEDEGMMNKTCLGNSAVFKEGEGKCLFCVQISGFDIRFLVKNENLGDISPDRQQS